jgi:polysaccharide export outer membrane protein
MKQSLIFGVVAIAIFVAASVVVSGGQEEGTRTNRGPAPPAVNQPGAADGQQSPALTGNRRPLYRLQKSDVMEINFTFSPEFNQERSVQPDGYITLLGLDPMVAEGLSVTELQQKLRQQYGAFLNDPEINIVLKDFEKPFFTALGEVGRPGKYELRADTTVTEALAIAGGINAQAKHSQIVLFRRVSAETVKAEVIDVKQMLKTRDLREDAYLRTGDFLYVPKSTMAKVKQYLPVSSMSMYLNPLQF